MKQVLYEKEIEWGMMTDHIWKVLLKKKKSQGTFSVLCCSNSHIYQLKYFLKIIFLNYRFCVHDLYSQRTCWLFPPCDLMLCRSDNGEASTFVHCSNLPWTHSLLSLKNKTKHKTKNRLSVFKLFYLESFF